MWMCFVMKYIHIFFKKIIKICVTILKIRKKELYLRKKSNNVAAEPLKSIRIRLLLPIEMIETLTSIDEHILLFFNGNHTPFMDELMSLITGKWIWIPFYLILIDLLFKRLGPKYAALTLLAVVLAIVMTDQICASVIRPYIGRLRPCNPDNPIFEYITIVKGISPGGYSWPSCHAANTFALATLLSCVLRSRSFTFMIFTWAIVVSISRLYLGVHYPTDILCGAAFGSVFGYISLMIVSRLYISIPRIYSSFRRPDVLS